MALAFMPIFPAMSFNERLFRKDSFRQVCIRVTASAKLSFSGKTGKGETSLVWLEHDSLSRMESKT